MGLAIVGCASDNFTGTEQVASPSAGADVNGAWNVTWTSLAGHNTYNDTSVSGGVVSVKTGEVDDECNVTGTVTLTEDQGVTHVTGPWTITTGLCSQTDSLNVVTNTTYAQAPGQIANGNLGSGKLTFSLLTNNRQFQYGLVQGTTISGVATWSVVLPARPNKSRGTLRGTFTATKQ